MNSSDLLQITALLGEAGNHGASLYISLNLLSEWGERCISFRRRPVIMMWRSRSHVYLTMILRNLLVICVISISAVMARGVAALRICMLISPSDYIGRIFRSGATILRLQNSKGMEVQCEYVEGTFDFYFLTEYFHPECLLPYLQRVNNALRRWVAKTIESFPA